MTNHGRLLALALALSGILKTTKKSLHFRQWKPCLLLLQQTKQTCRILFHRFAMPFMCFYCSRHPCFCIRILLSFWTELHCTTNSCYCCDIAMCTVVIWICCWVCYHLHWSISFLLRDTVTLRVCKVLDYQYLCQGSKMPPSTGVSASSIAMDCGQIYILNLHGTGTCKRLPQQKKKMTSEQHIFQTGFVHQ